MRYMCWKRSERLKNILSVFECVLSVVCNFISLRLYELYTPDRNYN